MMLKMIAIGGLAVLALSSVMSRKAFRMLVSACGVAAIVLCMGYVAAVVFSPADGRAVAMLEPFRRFNRSIIGPTFDQAAAAQTQRLMAEQKSQAATDEELQTYQAKLELPKVSASGLALTPKQQQQVLADVSTKIRKSVESLLDRAKRQSASLEVKALELGDLDIRKLNFQMLQSPNGKRFLVPVHDEHFADVIRIAVITKQRKSRLVLAICVCFAIGVVLCLLFALLKTLNARPRQVPEKDYLRLSDISMI